jgi:hypothetical protein
MTSEELSIKLKDFTFKQIDKLSGNNPMISFIKPLLTRAIDKKLCNIHKFTDLIADNTGNIDVENIISEMIESVVNTRTFTINTGFIGDIEIGDGLIKMQLPMTNKNLVFNKADLQELKDSLTKT